MKNKTSIITWLFAPFKYIAGVKALAAGIPVMALISYIAYHSNVYFDGALDIHVGAAQQTAPYLLHAFYQLCAWSSLSLVFYITGRIVTKTSVRLIDIIGTLALSQAPLIFAALWGFIPFSHVDFGNPDIQSLTVNDLIGIFTENFLPLMISALVMVVFNVWSIILKYNAYSVSANVKGVKGGVSFAVALIAAEILSKILIAVISPVFMSITS